MRTRTTAPASLVFMLAGAATALAVACRHDLDDFQSGRPDSAAPDTSIEPDTSIDGVVPDDGKETLIGPDAGVDTRDTNVPEVDGGPPIPEVSCTAVGPPAMDCIGGTTPVSFGLGAASAACPPSGCAAEMPEVTVKVSQFLIDQHEVTVGRFRAWWNTMPRFWPTAGYTYFTSPSKDLKWRNTWPTAPTEPPMTSGCFWKGAADASNDDKPMNCVDWYTALVFCMGDSGKRLPTEAEWEFVASGGEDRLFPWSAPSTEDGPITPVTCVHALNGTCTPATSTRDSTSWGRARYGTWNLAGSLAEWAIDGYVPNWSTVIADTIDPVSDPSTLSFRATRGGAYVAGDPALLRAAARPAAGINPITPDAQIGFRCVKRP